jgi:hypothetical protein
MNGMLNRLLENWLDSASERSYQSVFCQILAAKGHTILHSTRHSSLEFGKDVLTIGPDKKVNAYQLKGNPGKRVTLNQFREIQSQLIQLATQPPIFPGLKIAPFNTFLVTNGYIDEEVQRVIDDLNRSFEATKAIGRPIKVIQRGQFFEWANEFGTSLWPEEIKDVNALLQLLVSDGKEMLPSDLMEKILNSSLLMNENKNSAANIKRHITSTALLVEVCLTNFSKEKNYYALINAWVMFSIYVIGVCEKYKISFKKNGSSAVKIAEETIFHNLNFLCEELSERKHFLEGAGMVDTFVYRGRFTLLISLMSLYWLWNDSLDWPYQKNKQFLEKFIPMNLRESYLWGEGAIPQLLIHHWYLRKIDASLAPDSILIFILDQLIKISNDKGLPNPYYSFEDVTRHMIKEAGIPIKGDDPLVNDNFKLSSFYALSLMHLLVRTNMKQSCKTIWPEFSKLGFKHFEPEKSWMYCLNTSEKGIEITEQPKLTKEWEELKNDARDVSCEGIPVELKKNKFLLMLFVMLFPYRGTPSVIRYLGREFNETWFIDKPID